MARQRERGTNGPTERRLTVRRYVDQLLAADTDDPQAMERLARLAGWRPEHEAPDGIAPAFMGETSEEIEAAAREWRSDPANVSKLTDGRRRLHELRDRGLELFTSCVRALQTVAADAMPGEVFSGDERVMPLEDLHGWAVVTSEQADLLRRMLDGDQRGDWFRWEPGAGLRWQRPKPRNAVRRQFPLLARAAEILWDAILGHYGLELRRCENERCKQGRDGRPALFIGDADTRTPRRFCGTRCATATRMRRALAEKQSEES